MDYNLYIQKLIILNNNDCVLFNGLRFILMDITSPAFPIVRKSFLPFFHLPLLFQSVLFTFYFLHLLLCSELLQCHNQIKWSPFEFWYAQILSNKKTFRLLHLLNYLPSNSLVLQRRNQNKKIYSLFKIKTSTA